MMEILRNGKPYILYREITVQYKNSWKGKVVFIYKVSK